MGYYTKQHTWYCGIDLHSTSMFVSICDASGKQVFHENMAASPEALSVALGPYRSDVVVGCECTFSWYWLSDWCEDEGVPFVLGHALAMSAIHKAKIKNDSRDAATISRLLQSGFMPVGYAYPREMRATRDLLRRRMQLMQMRTQLLQHSQILSLTHRRQRLPYDPRHAANRLKLADIFDGPDLQLSLDVNFEVLDTLKSAIKKLEKRVRERAQHHDPQVIYRLRTIPGIGELLSHLILYETHDTKRFPNVQHYISYCRLITPEHKSNGKKTGTGNKKIGNAYLRWAYGEAACLMLRDNPRIKAWHQRTVAKKGKPKAMTILASRIARTAYCMMDKDRAFDERRFLGES